MHTTRLFCAGAMLLAACNNDISEGDADEPATSEVEQDVAAPCTISLAATPSSVVYGDPINLVATASCSSGTTVVQFYRNNAIIQPFSTNTTMTFDSTQGVVGANNFVATVKRNGVNESAVVSNTATVTIVDNVPQCTAVKMTAPADNSSGVAGQPITLAAQGTCPAGSTPEYSFYVKRSTEANWTFLNQYTLTTLQFTPPDAALWQVNAVVRTVGAHTAWQVRSGAIRINVAPAPVNHNPVANADSGSTLENTPATISVLANDSDSDGDSLSVTGATNGTNGTTTFTAGDVTYAPAPGFVGTDSFTYTISDGHGGTATGSVSVTVTTRPPTANDDTASTPSATPVSIAVLGNDTDPDGDALSVSGTTNGSNGSTSTDGTTVTYTPNANFVGSDSFTYTISDGHGGSAGATVTVTVTDQGPIANNDAASTNQNQAVVVDVLANDSDPDGGTLSVTAVTNGAHGTVTNNGTNVTYTPAQFFNGSDSFTYTVSDGQGGSATATVNVSVIPAGPGCSISIVAAETQVNWGDTVHLTATASCNTGAAQVDWWAALPGSALRQKAPFGSSVTFAIVMNDPELQLGVNKFQAHARTVGTTTPVATSNTVSVNVVDTVPSCTSAVLTSPTTNQTFPLGAPITLTATATCPAGVSADFLYFVKKSTDTNWTEIPGHVTGAQTFTPPTAGGWVFQATARAIGAHTRYQVRSMGIPVNVQ